MLTPFSKSKAALVQATDHQYSAFT